MVIRTLRVKNWRAWPDFSLELQPRLNLIYGPNESGKSSLQEALSAALTLASKPGGRHRLHSVKPWGRSRTTPEVQLTFQHSAAEWFLKRVFFGKGCELRRDGRVVARESQVLAELRDLLGNAGLSALLSTQGERNLAPIPAELRPHLTTAEALSPGLPWLETKLAELNEQFWTANRRDPRERLKQARDATLAAETVLLELRNKLEEVDRASREIAHFEVDLEALRDREEELEARLQREQEALESERRELALLSKELTNWKQDYQRYQQQLTAELTRQSEHDLRVAKLREKMGPAPDRSEIEVLQHRLRYCEAWQAEVLTRTLTELNAPEPDALKALEELLDRRERLTELLERLQQLTTAQEELGRLEQDASTRRDTLAELEQKISAQRQLVEEHQREREQQLEMKREADRLAELSEQWEEHRQVALSLHATHEAYRIELHRSQRDLGEEPSRAELDRLRIRARSCQLLAWRKEREQLQRETLPDVAALEALEERIARLREAYELAQVPDDFGALEQEVEDLRAIAAEASLRRRMAEERQPLAESVERWQKLTSVLRERQQESLSYAERLAGLKAKMGQKPDRTAPEELRARLRAVEAREQQLRQAELESLSAPARAALDAAEAEVQTSRADLRLSEKAVAVRRPQTILIGLVIGVAISFALGPIAAVIGGLVGAVVGFLIGSHNGSVKAAQARFEESSSRLKEMLSEHGLDSVEAARTRLERRATLEGGLRSLAVPGEIPQLTRAEVERELAELPARIEAAEVQLREATQRYEEYEQAHEDLLQSNPETAVAACREQLETLAQTFPCELRPEVPGDGEDGDPAAALARMAELEQALEPEEARKAEAQAKARLKDATERLQILRGEAKGRTQAVRTKLKLEPQLPTEEIAARLAELEAQLPEGGSAAARDRVASVRTRLEALDREEFSEADLAGANLEGLEDLDLGQLRQLLKTTQGDFEIAEEAWKKAVADYQNRRRDHDAVLARNPEAALSQALDQLRKLGMNLPEEGWFEFLSSGHPSLADRQQEIKVRLEELSARLTAEDPRPQYEELQRTLAEATSETTVRAKGQGVRAGQVEQLRAEATRAAAGLQLADLEIATCRSALAQAETQCAEKFAQYGAQDFAELNTRVRRAAELMARLEFKPACTRERLAELRAACADASSIEEMADEALVREREELEDRIARLDKAWEHTNRDYAAQQAELEELLSESPEEAVRTLRGELDRLSKLGDEDTVLSRLDMARERMASIDLFLKSDGGGDTPYEVCGRELKAIRAEAGELRSRSDTRLGTIQIEKDIYHRLARAEEAYRRAFAEQREVELEAGAVQLLKDSISEAKEGLEADLLGPLRARLDAQLPRLTQGRYRGVELTQDFTADQLATADDVKAPIGDLSVGTQEQLAFLSRVCLAQLLSEQDRMLVVFDDNLVHTDGGRLEIATEILLECAETCQVLLFTCHPERFGGLQEVAHRVELPTLVGI